MFPDSLFLFLESLFLFLYSPFTFPSQHLPQQLNIYFYPLLYFIDVNKFIWSALGWDPNAKPAETLRQYSRYLVSERLEDDLAQGLLALERNWDGPLLANESVYETLKLFQRMDACASEDDPSAEPVLCVLSLTL